MLNKWKKREVRSSSNKTREEQQKSSSSKTKEEQQKSSSNSNRDKILICIRLQQEREFKSEMNFFDFSLRFGVLC